ncbi:MAG: rhodanese-like domain-containing protein [Brumimicrobium sp.]
MSVKEICPTTTQSWLKEGALLVDVREKNEVDQLAYVAENLVHIPLSEFEDRFSELPKDKKIVMACRSGARSLRAANFLQNHGYDQVVNMQHGMIRWAEKGFPTKGDVLAVGANADSGNCCG